MPVALHCQPICLVLTRADVSQGHSPSRTPQLLPDFRTSILSLLEKNMCHQSKFWGTQRECCLGQKNSSGNFSNWNHIECIWIDRVLPRLWGRQYLQEKLLFFCTKKRNCGFCATIWNCRARVVETNIYEQGSMAVPSPRHHLVSKHTRCYFAQVRRVMDRQDHQLPESPATTSSPNTKISSNTNSKNHPSPRSRDTKITRSTEITKHQYPQQSKVQTPRPSRVPFDLTFSRAGVNCAVLDPSK